MSEGPTSEKADSEHWFVQNLHPHDAVLRGWLRSRFPSEREIDDVMQEAYIRVLRAKERREVKSPKAFLFATARNLAVDLARRRRVAGEEPLLAENEALFVLDEGDDIPEAVAHNQELEALTAAIQSLPDRCRQVFTLRKVYALSQKAIAAKLGISENTVSAQLTIGVQRCSEYMRRWREGGTR